MEERTKFEIWSCKRNKYLPAEILSIKEESFVLVRYKDGDEKIVTRLTFIEYVRNAGQEKLNLLSLFYPGAYIITDFYKVVVDRAEIDKEGNIRVYYKYLKSIIPEPEENGAKWEYTEKRIDGILLEFEKKKSEPVKEKRTPIKWIKYGCNYKGGSNRAGIFGESFKKECSSHNFITINPKTSRVDFSDFPIDISDSRRFSVCFEEFISRDTIVFIEKTLGWTMGDGKTWMEYFWKNTDGKKLMVKQRGESYVCIDNSDPKNPKEICSAPGLEELIESIVNG